MQVAYSPRRVAGFGLTDGEGIERLWSYLRKFCYMTKEMTASNRTDLLTEALLHYARRINQRQGKLVLRLHYFVIKQDLSQLLKLHTKQIFKGIFFLVFRDIPQKESKKGQIAEGENRG